MTSIGILQVQIPFRTTWKSWNIRKTILVISFQDTRIFDSRMFDIWYPILFCLYISSLISYNIVLQTMYGSHLWNEIQGVPKKIRQGFCLISRQPSIGFSNRFFLLKTDIHTQILNTNHFCAILAGRDIYKTKWDSPLDDSDQNLDYLI